LALAVLLLCVSSGPCFSSPSGLNNIPTADVAAQGVVVLQAWANAAEGQDTTWLAGAKTGLTPDLEVGLDSRVAPDGGPVTAQVKYRVRSTIPDLWWALGLANLSADKDRAGEPMPYAVATRSLGQWRAHLGYSAQKDAEGLFCGADLQISPSLLMRADWVRLGAAAGSATSVGALWASDGRLAFEARLTFPNSPPSATALTLKADWAFETGG